MARYEQQKETQSKKDLRVEFGQESDFTQYERGSISSREAGTKTKQLVELGEKILVEENGNK